MKEHRLQHLECVTQNNKRAQNEKWGKQGCWKGGIGISKLYIARMRFTLKTALDFINKIGGIGE